LWGGGKNFQVRPSSLPQERAKNKKLRFVSAGMSVYRTRDNSLEDTMTHPDWLRLDHIWLPYTQMQTAMLPLPVVAAEGTRLHLADGRVLIDGIANWWTACHGHAPPHIVAEVTAQLTQLPHVMFGGLGHRPAYQLAARLAALLPGDLNHVFFSESGSVAVEVGLKMAAQFWLNQGQRRTRFVSFRYGYHGDTFATMALCDPEEGMHALFRGLLADNLLAEIPDNPTRLADLERLLGTHRHEIAAVVIEPLVQGAGGMKFHPPQVLAALRKMCDRHDLLLIFDEIFTGFARTGTMFACEQAEVVPDIITVSKALTGGTLPLAATIANERVYQAFLSDDPKRALMHGPTYMAYPTGCAAALASLDLFEREPRLAQVAAIGEQLLRDLKVCRHLPNVQDVRVLGAIGVVQLSAPIPAQSLLAPFVERGVWVKPFGDVVYLTPPLTISATDLSVLTSAIYDVLKR
jgi:adenosylmethionine---8-amino-7-oxononanoate aminotransferase